MASTHSPFILQLSSKPDVGSNMALIHMGSPLCSIEHNMTAFQRKKLILLHRGLNIVKFYFAPIQSPVYPSPCPPRKPKPNQNSKPTLPEAPRLPEAACSLTEQLQGWMSWQDILPSHGKIL